MFCHFQICAAENGKLDSFTSDSTYFIIIPNWNAVQHPLIWKCKRKRKCCSQHKFAYFVIFLAQNRQSWLYPSLFSSLSPPDISLSVFAVTSKSMTVQWSDHTGASSYKITATPKNAPERPVFAHFGGNVVMGSVNSLSPNTVYTMQLDAMDNALNVLSRAETEETTGQWE